MIEPSMENRVASLEQQMERVLPRIATLEATAETIVQQNQEILMILRGARTVMGFAARHWADVAKVGSAFGVGIAFMAPKVQHFVSVVWIALHS